MTKTVDILSFNTVEVANKGDWMPLEVSGKATGIDVLVFGSESDVVRAYDKEQLKDYSRKHGFAEKKGKLEDFQASMIDKLEEKSVSTALVRIGDWRGATGDYDAEKMKAALHRNPQWIEDVIEFSKNVGK